MKRKLVPLALALILLGALVDRLAGAVTDHPSVAAAKTTSQPATVSTVSNPAAPSAIDAITEHAYAVASASVVFVDNVGTGTGSGVIYDSTGDIVTNAHVVNGATTLKVTLNNGRTLPARLLGSDTTDDLAVIHVDASGLQPARFAAAGTYHVAQMVLAVGSPLGLRQSVASGLISGLNRTEQEPSGAYLPNAIQTSAPINPGNSGGALVTLDGVVVGIPTLVQTSTSDGTSAQAIGFAIPSEHVVSIANQIIATGRVEHTGRAYLGVSLGSSQSASPFGFSDGNGSSVEGAAINTVASGSPADTAGLQQGDVITRANGITISSVDDMLSVLADSKPGASMRLTVSRGGSTMNVTVKLGELRAS